MGIDNEVDGILNKAKRDIELILVKHGVILDLDKKGNASVKILHRVDGDLKYTYKRINNYPF